MARTPAPLASSTGGSPQGGQLPAGFVRGFDRLLAIHRPVVLAHIRAIRRHNPRATPDEIVRVLERRYLTAVTTGGAFVGATAVIPGVGTGITLALSGVETAGFLEATALFAQSVSEVHGLTIDDPERARALVMTMMLGTEGSDLVRQLAGQFTGGGTARTAYWGELITTSLPRTILGPLTDKLKAVFIRQFAAKGGVSLLGKALPFGVGAVIGGTGNHLLGKRVVHSSRLAFGPAPLILGPELEPTIRLAVVRPRLAGSASERASRSLARISSGTRAMLPRGRRGTQSVSDDDPAESEPGRSLD
ncbi:hypothetical protein [Cryobacterium roopkundense]|uniref:Di-and tripeptidase n=1 Tax=Cryobacterium roopkundense TaxID=1001240 RepID=A0A7W8ZX86_9MICO|nr:hypothetical protein [Cryobacterium roopkundense]